MNSLSGRAIRRAHLLARLDTPQRRMLQLVYLDGLTISAAGALLGLSRREAAALARTARRDFSSLARP